MTYITLKRDENNMTNPWVLLLIAGLFEVV
jgi:hypothetical protein